MDTIGFGDTGIDPKELIKKTAAAILDFNGGINVFIFVYESCFGKVERDALDMLKDTLFADQAILNHILIVRTKFEDFDDPSACDADIADLNDIEHFAPYHQCPVEHVDNRTYKIDPSGAARAQSRVIILNHIRQRFLHSSYNPNLDQLMHRVDSWKTVEERLEDQRQETLRLEMEVRLREEEANMRLEQQRLEALVREKEERERQLEDIKRNLGKYIKSSVALESTKAHVDQLQDKIVKEIADLGGNPFLRAVFKNLDQKKV
ncbi:hypothetical protein SAMD00019534_123170 [Acytostelium subglobosum LB1]|uniref:hypothetical protein n=1 Tax=Acytostelium subglobosum LB1 TaxID=1410327 RepID=UPI000644C0E0|nr:hypothetical protein SAMD00019534_123170 [Acytostelium subglobosum LB1]GAM29141.1 hypothetical protein SAMD00019534_123170 [Acytostelium subglobosum LB1]|eukprot:XP_012747986.1 hypothetical protein SAMD00019534_123170 [Acytostelium subglobosum LB1]